MLPRGITGFWGTDTEPPLFLDEKAFLQMCHALAWENSGTAAEIDTNTTPSNFYSAQIRRFDDSVFILQNIHYPYAACARRAPSGGFVWTRQPKWLRLSESPVRYLSPDELNQDWRDLCGELSPEEQMQICYWNPQTVGEIIFNTWD